MPFVSKAQQRWAHTPAGRKALGGAKKVREWDQATGGKKLPDHVKQSKGTKKAKVAFKKMQSKK